ncbi:MAG TPA: hypothetical protein PK263_00610 [bacterium]|nr:hypothetical protein [bacterium]
MYHAIVIEESLKNKSVLEQYKILKTKIDGDWHLNILEIENIDQAIANIQPAMVAEKPYYWHIYDDGTTLDVIFREKIFHLDPNDKSTWREAAEYGAAKMNIPAEQLDFYPARFLDEAEWLASKD